VIQRSIVASDGTIGGVGFRANATKRLVLLATDASAGVEPDLINPYVGVGGVTVAASSFLPNRTAAPYSPGGRGHSIQET